MPRLVSFRVLILIFQRASPSFSYWSPSPPGPTSLHSCFHPISHLIFTSKRSSKQNLFAEHNYWFLSGFCEAETTMSARALFLAFFEFAPWLVTQDLHKSHNGMIFSNKARLLLDFSRVFQNASPCEIMWTIKQSLFIYLSGYVKHDVTQEVKTLDVSTNDARRDF